MGRIRATHSKSHTGCKTCKQRRIKCDEGRPSCNACIKSRRTCEGYARPAPDRASLQLRRIVPASVPPSINARISLDGFESASFDFFRSFTVRHLPQISWWQHILLDLAQQEQALAHAAIALGSLSRALIRTPSTDSTKNHQDQYDFALQQYNKAIALTRHSIRAHRKDTSLSESHTTVTLLSSLLFFCLEAYLGRNENAALHLRSGLRMLCEYSQAQDPVASVRDGRTIRTTASIRRYQDALTYTFVLMDADLHMINEQDPFLETTCTEEMPAVFQCVKEAHIHLDSIAQQADKTFQELLSITSEYLDGHPELTCGLSPDLQDFLLGCMSRLVPLGDNTSFLENFDTIRRRLCAWSSAWSAMPQGDEWNAENILCMIYSFYVEYRVETWRDAAEVSADRFEQRFDQISILAMQYLRLHQGPARYLAGYGQPDQDSPEIFDTPPLFTFGTGFVTTICLIAAKARKSSIRERCIQIIKAVNLQGFCSSTSLATYLRTIMSMENQRARALSSYSEEKVSFTADEVPEEARFFETMILPLDDVNNIHPGRVYTGRMAVAGFSNGHETPLVIETHVFS